MPVKDPFPANLLFDAELQSIFALLPAGVGILVLADNFWQAFVGFQMRMHSYQLHCLRPCIQPFNHPLVPLFARTFPAKPVCGKSQAGA